MYSYEERMKAVKLYIKYDLSAAATVRELGYPNANSLRLWYREYQKAGDLHEEFIKHPNFSAEQVASAVEHYLEHGRCIARTCRALGYPSRHTLRGWIDEHAPGHRKASNSGGIVIQYTQEQKKGAVIDLCVRKGSAASVADAHGASRESLYRWKNDLLGKESASAMKRPNKSSLPDDKDALVAELANLKEQVYRQQMELDILKKAAEILKKDQGIGQETLTNKEKCNLIDALRMAYPLNCLLAMLEMPKSSYFYQRESQSKADKYTDLRTEVKTVFSENNGRYGYRRVHAVIRNGGKTVSEKVIRRIMSEEKLVVPRKNKRKYSSYMGDISPAVENIVDRDFHADKPNAIWLTDLTEFHIPAGKVYLSPIIDCFDGLAVSWTIGTSPNAELVNEMLDGAICMLHDDEKPVVHSDRGGHYRWPGWISRMDEAGLTRSMSRKACPPDNAACEGFFGIIKNEMFYFRSWHDVSIEQFIEELDRYLRWYNEKRIKMSLGAMSPLEYRRNAEATAIAA
jgi:transposase InsO family protein/transposase-like protein